MLERTGTIPERKMHAQFLDRMPLEQERGITIKMQPVRMVYHQGSTLNPNAPRSTLGEEYVLNLIDTPGHIDFSYEVSRALKAVESVVLLVDSTQGVQAQTLTTFAAAKAQGCTIIPVVSKIDAPAARIGEVKSELAKLVGMEKNDVLAVSGKTGEGVEELLDAIIKRVPPPQLQWTSDVHERQRAARINLRLLLLDSSWHSGLSASLRRNF